MVTPVYAKPSFHILESADIPTLSFGAGDDIVVEGAKSSEMYVVKSGRVAIKVHGRTVEEIGPEGVFGEMGVIDHERRSGTVTALEPTVVVAINERLFLVLVQDTPNFALDLMRTLVERIRAMNDRL